MSSPTKSADIDVTDDLVTEEDLPDNNDEVPLTATDDEVPLTATDENDYDKYKYDNCTNYINCKGVTI